MLEYFTLCNHQNGWGRSAYKHKNPFSSLIMQWLHCLDRPADYIILRNGIAWCTLEVKLKHQENKQTIMENNTHG